jgi:hypothetical protein
MIPVSALATTSGTTTTVEVLKNGTPITTPVVTGIKNNAGMVEILSGLSEGDTVVTGH